MTVEQKNSIAIRAQIQKVLLKYAQGSYWSELTDRLYSWNRSVSLFELLEDPKADIDTLMELIDVVPLQWFHMPIPYDEVTD